MTRFFHGACHLQKNIEPERLWRSTFKFCWMIRLFEDLLSSSVSHSCFDLWRLRSWIFNINWIWTWLLFDVCLFIGNYIKCFHNSSLESLQWYIETSLSMHLQEDYQLSCPWRSQSIDHCLQNHLTSSSLHHCSVFWLSAQFFWLVIVFLVSILD